MSNLFENKDLSFKYSDNWKLMDIEEDLENVVAILDHKSGYSRAMLIKYPEEGLSLEYLKAAIDDIPRADTLNIVKSGANIMTNFYLSSLQMRIQLLEDILPLSLL